MGDEKVPLPDVDTRNPTVISQYGEWISNLVQEYNIDGLRIDGESSAVLTFLLWEVILTVTCSCKVNLSPRLLMIPLTTLFLDT